MDLKIKDVSELLNVPESRIHKWLHEGKIPAYKLNHQYLFSRLEIEDWMMKHSLDDDEEAHQANGQQQFSLYRAIYKGGVYKDIPGETKEEIIQATTRVLADKFGWDADVLADLLIDRERMMATALNNGIGVPHTRDFLINKHFDVVAVVFPKKPIDYGALDGKPVHTLFFLFASEDKTHLHLLAKIAHLSSQRESLDFLALHPAQEDLLTFLKSWEARR